MKEWIMGTFLVLAVIVVVQWVCDYSFHAVASITGDVTWDTDSFAKDRFLNGLTIDTTYSADDSDSSNPTSTLSFRIDNASDYTAKVVKPNFWCSDPNSAFADQKVEIQYDGTLVIPANSSISRTIPAVAYDGTYYNESWLTQGAVHCTIDFQDATYR